MTSASTTTSQSHSFSIRPPPNLSRVKHFSGAPPTLGQFLLSSSTSWKTVNCLCEENYLPYDANRKRVIFAVSRHVSRPSGSSKPPKGRWWRRKMLSHVFSQRKLITASIINLHRGKFFGVKPRRCRVPIESNDTFALLVFAIICSFPTACAYFLKQQNTSVVEAKSENRKGETDRLVV